MNHKFEGDVEIFLPHTVFQDKQGNVSLENDDDDDTHSCSLSLDMTNDGMSIYYYNIGKQYCLDFKQILSILIKSNNLDNGLL